METWGDSMAFKICCQIFEITYNLLVTYVIHWSFHNGVSTTYVHYADVFSPFIGHDWGVSAQVEVNFPFLYCT